MIMMTVPSYISKDATQEIEEKNFCCPASFYISTKCSPLEWSRFKHKLGHNKRGPS